LTSTFKGVLYEKASSVKVKCVLLSPWCFFPGRTDSYRWHLSALLMGSFLEPGAIWRPSSLGAAIKPASSG
jgi:hypothetical protein